MEELEVSWANYYRIYRVIMGLKVPNYIDVLKLDTYPVTHSWNDKDPDSVYLKPDEPLRNRIDAISGRGIFSLSVGIAEWIFWRLDRAHSADKLWLLLEAMWAGTIDRRYILMPDGPSWEKWQGPVRGPLCGAMNLLKEISYLLETDQPCSLETVCLYRLALHVLPDPKPFKEWLRFVIKRLSTTNPRSRKNYLGMPAPREALDPQVDYDAKQWKELIGQFLLSLDQKKNPFLAPPATMKKYGFEGKPYHV